MKMLDEIKIALDLAETELNIMYARTGSSGSNVLAQIRKVQELLNLKAKIEAKLFRIGNWIRTDQDEQIVAILCDCINTPNHLYMTYDDFELIELDQEWFLKFGFMRTDGWWLSLPSHYLEIIPKFEYNGDRYYSPVYGHMPEVECSVQLNRIRYVHELQNLFFSLTGRELEFLTD